MSEDQLQPGDTLDDRGPDEGIDGAGACAEESAVHTIDEQAGQRLKTVSL